jgi:hypothetical protein
VVVGGEANGIKKLSTQIEIADTTEWHFPK